MSNGSAAGSAPGSLADPLMLVVPFSIASSLSMTPRRLGCTITLESPRGFHGFLIWSCSTSGVETLTRERRPSRAAGLRSAFTGADGNARLTATTGLILLVLLPIEGLTLLSLHSFLSVHMLIGVALIPPVALKMGSTSYRFFRYYTGSPIFREKGPPQLVLRILVAPALVASTIALFGSGDALRVLEHPNSLVFTIHKGSFIVWVGAIGIHVLAYLRHLPRLAIADWLRAREEAVGRRLRRRLVAASLLAGGGAALTALPLVAAWPR